MYYKPVLFLHREFIALILYIITNIEILSILVIYMSINILVNKNFRILAERPVIELNSVKPVI